MEDISDIVEKEKKPKEDDNHQYKDPIDDEYKLNQCNEHGSRISTDEECCHNDNWIVRVKKKKW